MSQKMRNRLVLAKEESTYGTDPTPTASADAILTKGVRRGVYEGQRIGRDLDKPYLGNDKQINVGPHTTINFDVELCGSGTAGTAPQLGVLLKACGMSETVVASTSVTYAPVSSGEDSATLYYFQDGNRQVMTGARGTFVLGMSRGGIPMITFTFTGLYARPTAVALPTPTYQTTAGVPFNQANTTTFSVHSQAVYGESFSYNHNNEVTYRNLAGFEGVLISDRAPSSQVNFEAVTIATKDFFAAVESHGATITTDAINIVHGTAAGNIVTVNLPDVQLSTLSEEESDKIVHHAMEAIPLPSASGNDEVSIAFT